MSNIAARAAAAPTALHEAFAAWITEQTGVEVDLKTLQLVTVLRHDFQASPENQAELAKRKANAAAKRKSSAERKAAKLAAELAEAKGETEPVVEEPVEAVAAPVVEAPMEPVKVTILYKGMGEPEVHKQGCADIKRNRRKGDSQETVKVSSHTELTHIVYGDMIDSGESSLEDNYMAYNAKPCCPALDN